MRKEEIKILNDRGNELKFRIREMSATKLESWIIRAILILARGGNDLNVDIQGISGGSEAAVDVAAKLITGGGLSALSKIDYEAAAPLLEELLNCCTRITESGVEQVCTTSTVDGYIQDVKTLFMLRVEALKLNFDFFPKTGVEEESKSDSLPSKAPISINKKRDG